MIPPPPALTHSFPMATVSPMRAISAKDVHINIFLINKSDIDRGQCQLHINIIKESKRWLGIGTVGCEAPL